MDADLEFGAAADGAGDMDQGWVAVGELPEPGGGGVAEQGIGATGEHRGQAMAAEGELRVADGEDAAVDAVEAAGGDGAGDGGLRVAEWAEQLADRDDAVLKFGPLRQGVMAGGCAVRPQPPGPRSSFLPHRG